MDVAHLFAIPPIIVWKKTNTIIDGWHRYKICQELGIEPVIVEKQFHDRLTAVVYALTHQEARRNLTVEQKAIIGRKTLMLNEAAKAKQRKLAGTLRPKGWKVGEAAVIVARKVGVGTKSIQRAAAIAAEPKLEEMVYKGEISLHGASDFLKGIGGGGPGSHHRSRTNRHKGRDQENQGRP